MLRSGGRMTLPFTLVPAEDGRSATLTIEGEEPAGFVERRGTNPVVVPHVVVAGDGHFQVRGRFSLGERGCAPRSDGAGSRNRLVTEATDGASGGTCPIGDSDASLCDHGPDPVRRRCPAGIRQAVQSSA